MENEPIAVFEADGQLGRLVFEGREVEQARITITNIPLKVVARRNAVYYAEHQETPLSDSDRLELKNNFLRAVEAFNVVLEGS